MLMDTFEVMEPTYSLITALHRTIIFIITGVREGISIPIQEKWGQRNTLKIQIVTNIPPNHLAVSAHLFPLPPHLLLWVQTRLLNNTRIRAKTLWKFKKKKDIQRALYWKRKGYNFDPNYTTSFMMDQKVKDIERARYWKSKGYDFDPNSTTSFMMDQKVEDIQRANYWKTKGYNFNPDYMTGFMMDQKVSDIQRAAYWKAKGMDFNPDYMTSFMMDMEASNKGIH